MHDHPYALPDDKYEAFLADLAREFGVHLELHPTDVLEEEDSLTRTHSRLRFAEPIATDASPSLSAYPSLPPSSSCSSASSSSTPSPQTPFTPLSPDDAFAERFHTQPGEVTSKTRSVAVEPAIVLR